MSSDLNEIKPYLYLGSCSTASNLPLLQSQGITHVVNTAAEIENYHETTGSIKYLKLPFKDEMDEKISDHFQECLDFIFKASRQEGGGKVFVHCQAGISRSATIVIAYLMSKERMSLKDAYFHTKACRPQIGPNLGFFKELMLYEQQLFSIPEATFSYDDYCISSLMQMGFNEATATKAVAQSAGRIELAINFALNS